MRFNERNDATDLVGTETGRKPIIPHFLVITPLVGVIHDHRIAWRPEVAPWRLILRRLSLWVPGTPALRALAEDDEREEWCAS